MVSSNDEGEHGSDLLSRIVPKQKQYRVHVRTHVVRSNLLVELAQLAVLVGDGHTLEVAVVAYGLEVTTNEKEVDLVVVALFEVVYLGVDSIELSVATTLNGDLAWRLSMCREVYDEHGLWHLLSFWYVHSSVLAHFLTQF